MLKNNCKNDKSRYAQIDKSYTVLKLFSSVLYTISSDEKMCHKKNMHKKKKTQYEKNVTLFNF